MNATTYEIPEFKKVTIPLTQEYHDKARRIAIVERRTTGKLITFLLEQAIDNYLKLANSNNAELKDRYN